MTLPQERTLPFLDFMSSDSYDMNRREEFLYLLLRNSLVITKGKKIRPNNSDRCEYITLITEDDLCFRKGIHHLLHTNLFRV